MFVCISFGSLALKLAAVSFVVSLCAEAFAFESLVGRLDSLLLVICYFCAVDDLGLVCWFEIAKVN
jgi:hypothetical protein